MKLLFVPKPVLNDKMEVVFYCIRYQKADRYLSDQPLWLMDGAMHSPFLDILKMTGLNGLSNGLPIIAPLNKLSLLIDIENNCDESPEKIIFLLDDDTPPDAAFTDNIKRLKDLGFRFAAEQIADYAAMDPVLALCDFLFLDCQAKDFRDRLNSLKNKYRKLSFIASNVTDLNVFSNVKRSGFAGFEGKFYSKPVVKSQLGIVPIKVNRIQLLNIVRDEEFDISEVVKVVGQDPSLSVSLLKFVNSPYLGISQKIQTIQHAVAMLGQTEVRKWVTTATSGALADDKPDEVTKLSLMRAKFAENLAPYFEMAIHQPSLFLMGLFSVLDVILEMPMENALNIVTVSDKIHQALVDLKGDFAKVLSFIYTYEAADWNELNRLMILHNLNVDDIVNAYIEAAKWYSTIVADDPAEAETEAKA